MEAVVPNRSSLAFLFLVAVCVVLPPILATEIRYCNKRDYVVKVDEVKIFPFPVVTGKPTTFTFKGHTDQPLTGGKLFIDVLYLGMKVRSETRDFCKNVSCPISAGKFELSSTETLPQIAPPGSYHLKLKMEDEEKHQLTCIRFEFKIGTGSSWPFF